MSTVKKNKQYMTGAHRSMALRRRRATNDKEEFKFEGMMRRLDKLFNGHTFYE